MFKAIIIGGTGATGIQLVKKMINNVDCELITSIARKPVLGGEKNDKLVDLVIDSLEDLSGTSEHWPGHDVFFNCIGTTRKTAGSAEKFIKIESGISNEAARMASEAKIPHGSLISAKGANHEVWAVNWIHPLLYVKTMGQKQESVLTNYPLEYVSIFQPEMLIRFKNKETWFETLSKIFGWTISVEDLAAAMINDAIRVKNGQSPGPIQVFTGNDNIRRLLNL